MDIEEYKCKLYANLKPKPGQTMGEAKYEAWINSDYAKELNKKQREEAELVAVLNTPPEAKRY